MMKTRMTGWRHQLQLSIASRDKLACFVVIHLDSLVPVADTMRVGLCLPTSLRKLDGSTGHWPLSQTCLAPDKAVAKVYVLFAQ